MGIEAVNEEQNAIIEYVKNHFVGWMEDSIARASTTWLPSPPLSVRQ